MVGLACPELRSGLLDPPYKTIHVDYGFGSVQFRKFADVSPVYFAGVIAGVSPSNELRPDPPSITFARAPVNAASEFKIARIHSH